MDQDLMVESFHQEQEQLQAPMMVKTIAQNKFHEISSADLLFVLLKNFGISKILYDPKTIITDSCYTLVIAGLFIC